MVTFKDYNVPVNSTLVDDLVFTMRTGYSCYTQYIDTYSTVRHTIGNSFPLLPFERFTLDDLEAMEFQLLTQYTQNEVNSMLLYNRYSTGEVFAEKHPSVRIDFKVYDILSEDDLKYLIKVLKDFLCTTTV